MYVETEQISIVMASTEQTRSGHKHTLGHQMLACSAEEIEDGRVAESPKLFLVHASGPPPRRGRMSKTPGVVFLILLPRFLCL